MDLKAIAEKLAEALGHNLHCRKFKEQCTCGRGRLQAEALDAYYEWKNKLDKAEKV